MDTPGTFHSPYLVILLMFDIDAIHPSDPRLVLLNPLDLFSFIFRTYFCAGPGLVPFGVCHCSPQPDFGLLR